MHTNERSSIYSAYDPPFISVEEKKYRERKRKKRWQHVFANNRATLDAKKEEERTAAFVTHHSSLIIT